MLAVPYIKYGVAKAQPGLPRLAVAAPLIVANLGAPLIFNTETETLSRTSVIFIFTWLLTFKVLGLCCNRGPLVGPWNYPQLAAIILFPMYPLIPGAHKKEDKKRGRLHDSAGTPMQLLGRWLGKIATLALVVSQLNAPLESRPLAFTYVLYAFGLYSFVGFLMDGPAAVMCHVLGLEIIPTFDQPWMSTSLSDFWGHRWNITTSSILRTLVYDIIVDGRVMAKPGSKTAKPSLTQKMLGFCATFFVSGVVHELILWMIQPDGKWGWKWTMFFTMQGPLMVVEYPIKRWALKRGWHLHPWISRAITVPAMFVMAHYFFFSAVMVDTDTAERVVVACRHNFEAVQGLLMAAQQNLVNLRA